MDAAAKPRVAVVAFEGDPGGQAQDAVNEALGDDVQLLGHTELTKAVDKLGLDVNELEADKDLRKLSKELEADAIIQGKLSAKGGNKLLHFKLFIHNKKAKGFKIEFGSLKSKKFKDKLHDKMVDKLGVESAGPKGKRDKGGDGDTDALATMKKKDGEGDGEGEKPKKKDPDAEGDTKPKGEDGGEDGDAPRKKKKRVARGDVDADAEIEAGADAKPIATTHTANRVAIRLDVGGSGSQRKLAFVSRDYPQAPKGYGNSFVGGFRIEGQFYPFAFSSPKGAGGIGLAGMYDQTASLNLTSTAQPDTKFPVTQRRYAVGLRYRLVFGSSETSPTLTIGASYGHRTFKVNRSALAMGNVIDLPDTDYVGFAPMLELRIPIVARVQLTLGGAAWLLSGAGQIQQPDQYGQARVTEGEGSVGLDFIITSRFAVRVSGDFAQYGYKFTGNGDQTKNRDMEPSSPDVGGASDRYFGGALTLAVLY
jgi:hypothetical protein